LSLLRKTQMDIKIEKPQRISGEIEIPGDKSISHRSLIFGAISGGKTSIRNFLKSRDCLSTLSCIQQLGVEVITGEVVEIKGKNLTEPFEVLDCGNSGTTMRLLSGVVAAHSFYSVLSGDTSLNRRPMKRIITPLSLMGAVLKGRENDTYPPLTVIGKKLKGINYQMPVASAQVKSCIILATLFSRGRSTIEEPGISRDHTERMLEYFAGQIERKENKIIVEGEQELQGREVFIPGDFSSASVLMALTALSPGSRLLIKNVGLNPTRTGFLKVLEKMKVKFEMSREKNLCGEPMGDIEITGMDKIHGIEISSELVPLVIDEIPLMAVMACMAEGKTVISGAQELRVKESDRLKAIASELKKMGAVISEKEDGLEIEGPQRLNAATVNSWNDHRIAMAMVVAGSAAEGETVIENVDCIDISFPGFLNLIEKIGIKIEKV
jgi:3-phosphoshikimate 1-carboxyvinyltransferase